MSGITRSAPRAPVSAVESQGYVRNLDFPLTPGRTRMPTPNEYDPELTEHLLEATGKLLQDSRRLLDDLDDRLDEDPTTRSYNE